MEYRRLGQSGLKVSVLSFGSWITFGAQVDLSTAKKMMMLAFDQGVNFFDNAENYANGQSEIIMGEALAKLRLPRDAYCVSSKAFWGGDLPTQRGLSRKHLTDACHHALTRLHVDYLDIFFCHRPDEQTPIEETVAAMHHLIQQGKVLYWGTSEWRADQIMQAYAVAKENHFMPPTLEQPQYNLFVRDKVEHEYRRLYQEIGLGLATWSPLASGLLTGKYNTGVPKDSRFALKGYEWLLEQYRSNKGQQRIEHIKQFASVAADVQLTLAELAITWCLNNPNVSTVILGASKPWQLQENLKAIHKMQQLTPSTLRAIEEIMHNNANGPQLF